MTEVSEISISQLQILHYLGKQSESWVILILVCNPKIPTCFGMYII